MARSCRRLEEAAVRSGAGMSPCWIAAAIFNSCSSLAFSVASRYSRAILDGHGRFGRQRLQGAFRHGDCMEARFALSRYSTPIRFCSSDGFGHAPHSGQDQRHAHHVADAEGDRCPRAPWPGLRPSSRDDAGFAGLEDLLGDLAARVERAAGRVMRPLARPTLNSSLPSAPCQHDEPALGSRHPDGESTTIASTSSSTAPDPIARNPSSRVATCRRSPATDVTVRSSGRRGRLVEAEDQLASAALADLDSRRCAGAPAR